MLSNEDTKLTPYSIMSVKLAAQVSSSTVSKTLTTYGKFFYQNIFGMVFQKKFLSIIEWTVIFRPSNVCQERNILLEAFLDKLPGRCLITPNQF